MITFYSIYNKLYPTHVLLLSLLFGVDREEKSNQILKKKNNPGAFFLSTIIVITQYCKVFVIEYLLLHYYTNKESLTLTNKSYTKKSVCYLSGDHLNNVVDPLNKVSI